MQAVREGSKCQPMIMFNEWIRRIKEIGNKGKMWVLQNSHIAPSLPCIHIHLLSSDQERHLWSSKRFQLSLHVFVCSFPLKIFLFSARDSSFFSYLLWNLIIYYSARSRWTDINIKHEDNIGLKPSRYCEFETCSLISYDVEGSFSQNPLYSPWVRGVSMITGMILSEQ